MSIHSDGYGGEGTIIADDQGNRLEGVRSADIYIEAGEPVRVNLEIKLVTVAISATVDEHYATCPSCKVRLRHQCEELLGDPMPGAGETRTFTATIMGHNNLPTAGIGVTQGVSMVGATVTLTPVTKP